MFHHTLRLSALALACASLGALADTTIYGKINLSLEHVAARGASSARCTGARACSRRSPPRRSS